MIDGFEWDATKATSNAEKHGIEFDEAATVFVDPLSLTIDDPDHSLQETRFVTIGMSEKNRVLTIVHTERDTRVRLISARRASAHERKFYEESRH